MLAFPNAGRPLSFNSAGHVAGDHDAKERSYKVSPHAIERVCSGVRLLKRQVWWRGCPVLSCNVEQKLRQSIEDKPFNALTSIGPRIPPTNRPTNDQLSTVRSQIRSSPFLATRCLGPIRYQLHRRILSAVYDIWVMDVISECCKFQKFTHFRNLVHIAFLATFSCVFSIILPS
jgi:hypothetical protein